ncbi:hypothetical protein [Prevotella histicola]|nr:hypothetical protein [Prevotella histicola]
MMIVRIMLTAIFVISMVVVTRQGVELFKITLKQMKLNNLKKNYE